jgi:FAD/FMN-containing dehydrogenase
MANGMAGTTNTMTPPNEAAIQNFRAQLKGPLLLPADDGYHESRRVWNGTIDKHPAIIVRAIGVADVTAAVRFARQHGLNVAVRGGGHSFAGLSVCDDHMLVDMSLLKGIRIHPEKKRAWVQAGCLWGDFDREAQSFGLATTGGLITHTGVAGLTLGGGIGWLMRKFGLTIDNVESMDVVLPDGSFAVASRNQNSDLYWGLRGGGGNFGIVTSFEFTLHEVGPQIYGGLMLWRAERAREVLHLWRDWIKQVPDELTSMIAFLTAPPAPFVPPDLQGKPVIALAQCDISPFATAEKNLEMMRGFGPPDLNLIGPMPYIQLQSMLDDSAAPGLQYYLKSQFVKELNDGAVELALAFAGRMTSPRSMVHIHHMGGAVSKVRDSATAYGDRDAPFLVNWISVWENPEERETHLAWARDAWTALKPFAKAGVYVNFLGDTDPADVQRVYGKNLRKLVDVKRKYDPDNTLCFNQNIDPQMKLEA